MFAYCYNNPISYVARDGQDPDVPTEFDPQESIIDLDGIGKGAQFSVSPSDFLKSYGANSSVLKSFSGSPKVVALQTDATVYRYWGGKSPEYSHWVSPYDYGVDARSKLALPAENTMARLSTFTLPAGTTVLVGYAAACFNQLGGGVQWWVPFLR